MKEDKILRQNKIPGCERLTRPEEIAALSKYLKKIKQTYDENTELERDTLEIPGKTTGQFKEINELSTESIKLKGGSDIGLEEDTIKLKATDNINLSDYIEKLTDSNNVNLNTESAKLKVNENITLSDYKEGLSGQEEIALNENKEGLKVDDYIELADGIITINAKTNTELSNEKVDLKAGKETELETKSIGLKDKRKVELENSYEILEDKRKIELENNYEILENNRKNPELNDKKEGLIDDRKTDLNNKRESLTDPRQEVKLNSYRENFTDDRKEKLADKKEIIYDKRKIDLNNHKEVFSDDRVESLNNKRVDISPIKDTQLENKRVNISPEDTIGLSNYRENFTDDRDTNLEDEIINLDNTNSNVSLSDFKDELVNGDFKDTELEDEVIIRPANSSSDAGDGHNFIEPKEASLSDALITLGPDNPEDNAGNDHNFINPSDATLEDGIITLTPNDSENTTFINPDNASLSDKILSLGPEDPQDDAGNNHNFINPNNAELEDEIIIRPENSSSDAEEVGVHNYWNDGGDLEDEVIPVAPNLDDQAGDGHNFMNPDDAQLEDEIIPLTPNDPENTTFINPNEAELEDEVIERPENDPENNAGDTHNFMDPDNAELEDELLDIPETNPDGEKRLDYLDKDDPDLTIAELKRRKDLIERPENDPDSDAGEGHNFMNPDDAELEDEVVNRPDISSSDARYDGGGYDYIEETETYITDPDKIDSHKKKILRPQASLLDARLTDLYKYKDKLNDSELYEEVIKLLESIGNDHEYDNVSSTTENFHKMTGTVGSASWVQKLESLVSAYLSSDNKISPRNAHRFENSLYDSLIVENRVNPGEYNFIDNNTASEDGYNEAKQQVENYNEEVKYKNKNFKIPVEGMDTGGGLFGMGPQSPAEKFEKQDKENYEINQARVGVPEYQMSDLLWDSIQNGSFTNFNLASPESYLNLIKQVGNSDISISRYLRYAAEQACKLNGVVNGGSTTRRLLLEETLAALVFARDYIERLTKSNRDRLPGDDKWYASLINGGVGEFVNQGINAGRNWLLGKAGIINPDKNKPVNRPSADVGEYDRKDYEVTGYRPNSSLKPGKIENTGIKFKDYYTGGKGLYTTLNELCKANVPSTLAELKEDLKNAPYITTPDKFGSFSKNGSSRKFGSYSLDTNAYWEVILEPLCCEKLNGGLSFLPSIQEINVMNKLQHGIVTRYSKWIPFISFDLQKSKMIGKSLSLFDGEINYPSSVELTNELRLTVVDDEFKSWRQYFQKCMEVSVYNSTPHKEKDQFYEKTTDSLLQDLARLTIVDKDVICIAFYKNITFNIRIYLMNPQYSTVRYYNLLCVLKDFSEEYNGDTDGGAQDLNLTFSIVGELDHNTPKPDYSKIGGGDLLGPIELPNAEIVNINNGGSFWDGLLGNFVGRL